MPQQIRIWDLGDDDLLKEVPATSLDKEERLQNWLARDISLVADDLLVIGREVPTAFGGRIDLLCLDRRGDLVIIELKRDNTPRDVTAQVLDYASWVKDLTAERINDLAKDHPSNAATLGESFREKFGEPLPETLNLNHRLLIVASEMDDSTERIVRYLSDAGIGINVVTFQHFTASDSKELVARVFLIEPTEAEAKAATRSKRKPSLSIEQIGALAQDRGVSTLYERLDVGLSKLLETKKTNQQSVSFYALIRGMNRVLINLEPGYSDVDKGLSYYCYTNTLGEYLHSNGDEVVKLFPTGLSPERGSPGLRWRSGRFQTIDEVDAFLTALEQARSHNAQQTEPPS